MGHVRHQKKATLNKLRYQKSFTLIMNQTYAPKLNVHVADIGTATNMLIPKSGLPIMMYHNWPDHKVALFLL